MAAPALKADVTHVRGYPIAEEPDDVKRPFRLWDTRENVQVARAYFINLRHAHMRALCEAAWSRGDSVFEVFDIRNGGLRGQYQRHGSDIKFWRSSHALEDQ